MLTIFWIYAIPELLQLFQRSMHDMDVPPLQQYCNNIFLYTFRFLWNTNLQLRKQVEYVVNKLHDTRRTLYVWLEQFFERKLRIDNYQVTTKRNDCDLDILNRFEIDQYKSGREAVNKNLCRNRFSGWTMLGACNNERVKKPILRRTVESDAESWTDGVRKQSLKRRRNCSSARSQRWRAKRRERG